MCACRKTNLPWRAIPCGECSRSQAVLATSAEEVSSPVYSFFSTKDGGFLREMPRPKFAAPPAASARHQSRWSVVGL